LLRPHTLRKQAGTTIGEVPAQEPSVSEVIISLYQLYPIALRQTQFIRAPSNEIVNHQ